MAVVILGAALCGCGGGGLEPANGVDAQLREAMEAAGAALLPPPAEQPAQVVELGRLLYFDKLLSGNRDISCATCHHPTEATGDGLPGVWQLLTERVLAVPQYAEMFARAYPEAEQIGFEHVAGAIAAFEAEAFFFDRSPFDLYLAGESSALSAGEKRGGLLFFGKARCSDCHNGPALTDQRHHNLAVPQLGPGKDDPTGADRGRFNQTGLPSDLYAFRTPPLRNVALTGPWMHDGCFETLEDTVRHMLDCRNSCLRYDGAQLSPPFQDVQDAAYQQDVLSYVDPLAAAPVLLTDAEFADLLSFLNALTDPRTMGAIQDLMPAQVPSGLPVED